MTAPLATPQSRLCLALDTDADDALRLVSLLKSDVGVFKIGLELFVAEGPSIVRAISDLGVDVFLDLKLHDIPATVHKAVRSASKLGVRYLTVHASGGPTMLVAAQEAALAGIGAEGPPLTLLAVTALTSLSDAELATIGFAHTSTSLVPHLARQAADAGIGGLVCSPREVAQVKAVAPALFCVTPGIRGPSDDVGDQVRTMSAPDAIAAGADLLVVGRPIRGASDPVAAARALAEAIAAVTKNDHQQPAHTPPASTKEAH